MQVVLVPHFEVVWPIHSPDTFWGYSGFLKCFTMSILPLPKTTVMPKRRKAWIDSHNVSQDGEKE